jgi:tetratricopeptide (TPR) repeat protein
VNRTSLALALALSAACAHDKPPAPAAAEGAAASPAGQGQQPGQAAANGSPQGDQQQPAPAAAPQAAQPGQAAAQPAASAKPKSTQFAPVAAGQQPTAETQSAQNALRGGNYEQAISEAKRALSRNERWVPAMIVLARAYYNLRKYELATSILDTAAQIDDHNAQIYFIRAHLALARDDKPSALAGFKAAVERDPNYASAWNDLAVQYLVVHNFDGAAQAANNAVQLQPRWTKALINLGSALRGQKQYDEAAKRYQDVIKMEPNNPDAWFNLGILYLDAEKLGGLDNKARLEQAVRHLSRYKEVAASRLTKDDPADSYIAEAQKAIEREQKRLDRQRREAERNKAKAAPAPAPASTTAPPPAPTAPEGGNPK